VRGKAKVKRQKVKGKESRSFSAAVNAVQSSGLPRSGDSSAPRLLDRWWVGVVAAVWVVGIVVIYYRLQLVRLVQVLAR
jgi:hypothetical protein